MHRAPDNGRLRPPLHAGHPRSRPPAPRSTTTTPLPANRRYPGNWPPAAQPRPKHSGVARRGEAGEQLAPLAPGFHDRFDPSEARFLGAPIDYVVFDGLGSGELREVVLLEVKTGGSRLNANERQVERAIAEGRVRFETLRLR